jgi:hypothetical protein
MDPNNILQSVNEFYQQAWDKLLIYTTVLVALVGILLPVIQSFSQRTHEKALRKGLEKYFDDKVKEIEDKLEKDIDRKMQDKIEEMQVAIEKRSQSLEAGILVVQGNNSSRLELHKLALSDYCRAGFCALKAEDMRNLQRINANILMSLPKLSKEELVSIQEEDNQLNNYILILEENDKKGAFIDLIISLKREISKKMKLEDKPRTV